MGQTNLQRASTGFSGGQLQESLTVAATNPIAAQKGAMPLQPEESVSFTLGAAFSLGDMDVTIDWFNIQVDDRIALTQQIELTAADKTALLAQGIVGVNTVSTVSRDGPRQGHGRSGRSARYARVPSADGSSPFSLLRS